MYQAFLQLDSLTRRASISQALVHTFSGINTYPPQRVSFLSALKPYLLGNGNMFNALWQTPIRYNTRQDVSPANCAVVPKKTHVVVSNHSTLTAAVPVVQHAAPMLAVYCQHTELSAPVPGREASLAGWPWPSYTGRHIVCAN